jgi:hypothetical protein
MEPERPGIGQPVSDGKTAPQEPPSHLPPLSKVSVTQRKLIERPRAHGRQPAPKQA